MNIRCNITNQIITITDTDKIVNQSHNYLKIYFDFLTEDWADKTVYVLLKNEERKTYEYQYNTETGLTVPYSVLKGNLFRMTVYGVNQDNTVRITTNELTVRLLHSGYTSEIDPIEDTDIDVIADLYLRLDEKLNIADYIVDSELDEDSNNPVSNSAVTEAINNIEIDPAIVAEISSLEVKASFRALANRIRTQN